MDDLSATMLREECFSELDRRPCRNPTCGPCAENQARLGYKELLPACHVTSIGERSSLQPVLSGVVQYRDVQRWRRFLGFAQARSREVEFAA